MELGGLAKAKGYALQAKNGLVRVVTAKKQKGGFYEVNPVSDWLDYDAAKKVLAQ